MPVRERAIGVGDGQGDGAGVDGGELIMWDECDWEDVRKRDLL